MMLREQLIRVATLFGDAKGLQPSQVSRVAFTDGKTLPRVLAGGDVTTGSFEAAMRHLSDKWPEAVTWPSDIPRPDAAISSPQRGTSGEGSSPSPGATRLNEAAE